MLCATDRMAVGALHAIASAGLRAGRDISVIGYDDLPIASYTDPPLTTLEQPIEPMARRMVEMLLAQLDGASAEGLAEVWPARLIARHSDGPAPPDQDEHRRRREDKAMRASLIALRGALASGLAAVGVARRLGAAPPARARDVTFLSTQMRPIEEAQRMRTEVLKASPAPVTFVPEEPSTLSIHLQADRNGGHTISLVGALHGELAPLVTGNLLAPLDDMASLLTRRGVAVAACQHSPISARST